MKRVAIGPRHTKVETTMSNQAQGSLEAEVQQWVREAAEAGDYAKADNLLGWRHHGTVANSEHISATVRKGKTEKKDGKGTVEPRRLKTNRGGEKLTLLDAIVFRAVVDMHENGLLSPSDKAEDVAAYLDFADFGAADVLPHLLSLKTHKGLVDYTHNEEGEMINLRLTAKAKR
jgi:hypothetical protein